jgi:hypothetical protein
MNPRGPQGDETERDLQKELTELEWFASQRELTPQEKSRLQILHQQRAPIKASAVEEITQTEGVIPAVDGDDSP